MKFYKKKDNKGFSLVELIIAVAVLAVVVIPLLQAFTTSANLTSRSRKAGEATAAAQNIQEVIQARTVSQMRKHDDAGHMDSDLILQMLGVSKEDTQVADNGDVIIQNIRAGSKEFDAKVEFSAGSDESSAAYSINGKDIAQYTDMTGTFSQSYASNQNPDMMSASDFPIVCKDTLKKLAQDNGLDSVTYDKRQRTIVINVESLENPDGGFDVDVIVTFKYKFHVLNKWYSKDDKKREMEYSFSIFPESYHIASFDKEVACYLMYYPFYENLEDTETINIYVDYNNSESDLKFKLFLVKQIPMVLGDDGKFVSADTVATKWNEVKYNDSQYKLIINEYHNSRLNLDTQADGTLAENMRNVYTNANRRFGSSADTQISSFTYKIKKPSAGGWFYFSKQSDERNQLVKTEKEDRFYNVVIYIYDKGTVNQEGASPIHTLEASKLK